ncbi:MAG: NAD(P)/FAD-dependent oxidoreductase [Bacteroidota bacterium]
MHDVVIVGAGMAGMSAAALLAQKGLRVLILEQNWIPGGCVSSYPRHGYVFEAGATTLVGLDEGMPLHHVIKKTKIQIPALKLKVPMKVHLKEGKILTRHENLDAWIAEAERHFGPEGQRPFWEYAYRVSQKVWNSSLKQRLFPPTRFGDLLNAARNVSLGQVSTLPLAFRSTERMLKRFGLHRNASFRAFVDEQLLITAQNFAPEVNVLFGATALCYTNYGNYYCVGGMLKLIEPLVQYVTDHGGELKLRHRVTHIHRENGHYRLSTKKHGDFRAKYLLSAIPLNNTLPLFSNGIATKWERSVLPPERLRSAFQMGIAFRRHRDPACIHHQIHLETPLPYINAKSIFLSLSHPDDHARCAPDQTVASVSTHVFGPQDPVIEDKSVLEALVVEELERRGFLKRENILYQHSSTPFAWEKWTARAHGFVGGYPQYMSIKPWQMKDARLDGKGAYICGDSTYPGQGIPGACLSGVIAVEKMAHDHRLRG